MNKRDLYLRALGDLTFLRRAWIFSAFAIINEAPDAWQKDPYNYRIVYTPVSAHYVDPDTRKLVQIEDAVPGQPIYAKGAAIDLKAGEVPNLFTDVTTTYGNVLFNYVSLVWPFGKKIPFQLGRVNASDIEELILPIFRDDPLPGEPRSQEFIYVSEYLKFSDSMSFLTNFTQLFVPGGTKKTLTAHPGMAELKKRLLEENKDRLHDPAVIAKIEAELIALDKEWLKGDPGENFLISKKSMNIVRKKMFGMYGAEPGLEEKVSVDLIANSLSEGWDVSKYATLNNILRAGSFNRGAQTELGGEAVKSLLRASSNINIVDQDCGSTLGAIVDVDGSNFKRLVGYSVVTPEGPLLVTRETAPSYVGKTVIRRSPQFCNLPHSDYCAICVGENLAQNPDGASVGIAEIGSLFLAIFMSAAHSKGTSVAKMDVETAFI